MSATVVRDPGQKKTAELDENDDKDQERLSLDFKKTSADDIHFSENADDDDDEDDDDFDEADADTLTDTSPAINRIDAIGPDWPRSSVDANLTTPDAAISANSGIGEEGGSGEIKYDDNDDGEGSEFRPSQYDVGKTEDIEAGVEDSVPAYLSGEVKSRGHLAESDQLPTTQVINPPSRPSADCRCTIVSNCGQCVGGAGETGRATKRSVPAAHLVEVERVTSEKVAQSLKNFSSERLNDIGQGHVSTRASGDSGSIVTPPIGSETSESMAFALEHLSDCDCKAPLLKRIRQLSNRLRNQMQSEEEMRIKRDRAVELSQKLKEELMKWSQAGSYFDQEKIKMDSQLHRVEFEKEKAAEKMAEKVEILEAMKTRLKKREDDYKSEVDNEKALRLELTHAEARVRLVEGWAEQVKIKAEQDREAKLQADKERATAFQRAEQLQLDLIEIRRIHSNDTTARSLQTEKEALQIKLNSTQDELRAVTAEYKRLFETKNAKPRYQDLADRVTELLKENAACSSQLEQLKCQSNMQINDLHKDKNNVNAELHRVTREMAQIQLTDANLRAANGIIKQELDVTKRDTTELRKALADEKKLHAEETFKHKLTVDQMRDLLTRARQEIVSVKAKLSGVMGKADHLQELASKRAREYIELQSESERKLLECSSSMIHSTEELHGQIELLKVALLKKAEELQILKETHEKCPGVGSVNLQPISVRLGPDGKYEAVEKMYSQTELDEIVDALETQLNSMKEDNDRLKEIIKGYDCCCSEKANEELESLKQELDKSDLERSHLRNMAQHLLPSKDFLATGLNSAIEEHFGGLRGTDADIFIERINGVKRLIRPYELENVRQRMHDMGVPSSLFDFVIDEEEDESPEAQLDDLFDLLCIYPGDSKDQIAKLSAELQHYKELEERLSQSNDVEHGIAKSVVGMIKADVIESLDAPIEVLSDFKTFLWQHESAFDEEAYKTNRDLTASIREDLERETGELHKMLQQLKQKLLDLLNSGLSDEERQRALLEDKEQLLMAIESTSEEGGIKTIRSTGYGLSPEDMAARLGNLQMDQTNVDAYVESEAKRMKEEVQKRWEAGDITEEEAKALMKTLLAPTLTDEEKKALQEKLTDGTITVGERKEVLKALAGDDREEMRKMLEQDNPWISKRQKRLSETAKLSALIHDDKLSQEKRNQLKDALTEIQEDETLTQEEKKRKIKEVLDNHIQEERQRSIDAIMNDDTLSEEEKRANVDKLMDKHLQNVHARALENIQNDLTLTDSEKEIKLLEMREQANTRRSTIDLVDIGGSLSSLERERLQKRIDEDWVLTDEERQKLAARLTADQEKREKKANEAYPDDEEKVKKASEANPDNEEKREKKASVAYPDDEEKEKKASEANPENEEKREKKASEANPDDEEKRKKAREANPDDEEKRKKASEANPDDERNMSGFFVSRGGPGQWAEDGGESKGRESQDRERKIHERTRGKMGLAQNWIGYFNSLAGILPNPDEVCTDVQTSDGNVNANSESIETKQRKVKAVLREHRREKRETEQSDHPRRHNILEREVRELDEHPVVQKMRKRRDERRSKNKSSDEEMALTERRGQSARRGQTMEERVAELNRKISAYSDIEETNERKRQERRTPKSKGRD